MSTAYRVAMIVFILGSIAAGIAGGVWLFDAVTSR
jgi:hypothetical protein